VDPMFTVHHVREAVAIRGLFSDSFGDAYSSNDVHLPPLSLAVLEYLLHHGGEVLLWFLVACLDLRIAVNLFVIAKGSIKKEFLENKGEDETTMIMDERIRPEFGSIFPVTLVDGNKSFIRLDILPSLIGALYYITGCFSNGKSFQNIGLFFLTESLATSSLIWSAFCAALAMYHDVHCIVFLIPLFLLHKVSQKMFLALTVYFTFLFQWIGYHLVSHRYTDVVVATHFHSFAIKNMNPSLSILWYFSMEMFRRFRLYFQLVLGGLPYCIVVPTTIRLYKYPSALVRALTNLA